MPELPTSNPKKKPANQPYGIREFALADINGVTIVFGQEIETDS